MRLGLLAIFATSMSASVSAATFVSTGTVRSTLPGGGLGVASLTRFDPSLGTVNNIKVSGTSFGTSSFTVGLVQSGPFTVRSNATAQIKFNLQNMTGFGPSIQLTSTDEVIEVSGPLAYNYAPVSFDYIVDPTQYFTFVGQGIYYGLPGVAFGSGISNLIGTSRVTAYSFTTNFTVTVDYTPSVAAVPEPAAWAMLLVGFSAIGTAMRRRPERILAMA